MRILSATAFAPATVANVAVGFDILGFAIHGVGDHVTVTQTKTLGVVMSRCLEFLGPAQFRSTPKKIQRANRCY